MVAVPVNFVIAVSFSLFIFYIIGLYDSINHIEKNGCEMTYMFEYPQYVGIDIHHSKKFPRYNLYGYSEGALTKKLRRMQFTGIPVIFIPGNKGSHKQGRSLASVALRKALNARSPLYFDFFLIDFNEDLSGMYGGVLNEQSEFLAASIKSVLEFYKGNDVYRPTSVILIGHSIGGIVAKSVFTRRDFDSSTVQLLITLATPHTLPVVQSDQYMVDFYREVAKIWNPRTMNVSHVTFVSLGGGKRDILVRSDLTNDPSADISTLTTGVPGVHCSTDHLSITWCKQLMLTIIRALFDCIDMETRQLSSSSSHRLDVFEYHFLQRSAGKKYLPHSRQAGFEQNARWVENLLRQFSVIEKSGVKKPQFLMLRLIDDIKHEAALIEGVNLNVKDWVYACIADVFQGDSRVCDQGINLSNMTEIMPAQNSKRKKLYVNMLELRSKGFTHVLVRIPPSSELVQANIDVHRQSDRFLTQVVPRFISVSRTIIVDETMDNAIHYSVSLQGFDQIWQAYQLGLEAISCKTESSHAVVTFTAPWANETSHFSLVDKMALYAVLTLTNPRPPSMNKTAAPVVTFTLDPSCKYRISISPDKIATAGQIARYYSTMLPGYILAVLLLTLRRQFHCLEEESTIPLYHNALAHSVRNYYVLLQATIIGSRVLAYLQSFLPQPDLITLQEMGLDFFVLSIILFGVAVAVNYIIGAAVYAAIIAGGHTANKLALKFITRAVTGLLIASEWAMSGLQQLPFIVSIMLLSLLYSTTGGLIFIFASAFYFLKLCKMYDDYLEELFKISLKFVARTIKNVVRNLGSPSNGKSDSSSTENEIASKISAEESSSASEPMVEGEKDSANVEEKTIEAEESKTPTKSSLGILEKIHFHVTMFLLYVVAALLAVPSVLAWSRDYINNPRLVLDPFLLPAVVFTCASWVFWQGETPKPNKRLSQVTSSILFFFAAMSIMYGAVSMYRLPYVLSATAAYLMIHQLTATWLSPSDEMNHSD